LIDQGVDAAGWAEFVPCLRRQAVLLSSSQAKMAQAERGIKAKTACSKGRVQAEAAGGELILGHRVCAANVLIQRRLVIALGLVAGIQDELAISHLLLRRQ
jgi:hypothetical protein